MDRFVALLRGINVGGNNMMKMSELRICFEQLGFTDVITYINSGNVFFEAKETDQRKLEECIEARLYGTFGFTPKTVVRSKRQMDQVIKGLPKSWATNLDQKFNVIFLRYTIDSPDILKGLNPKAGIETLEYKPGVLYWSTNTSDLTKSSMIQLAKSELYKDMTVRNLNTTKKLNALLGNN